MATNIGEGNTMAWTCPVCGKGVAPHKDTCSHLPRDATGAPIDRLWPGFPNATLTAGDPYPGFGTGIDQFPGKQEN